MPKYPRVNVRVLLAVELCRAQVYSHLMLNGRMNAILLSVYAFSADHFLRMGSVHINDVQRMTGIRSQTVRANVKHLERFGFISRASATGAAADLIALTVIGRDYVGTYIRGVEYFLAAPQTFPVAEYSLRLMRRAKDAIRAGLPDITNRYKAIRDRCRFRVYHSGDPALRKRIIKDAVEDIAPLEVVTERLREILIALKAAPIHPDRKE